MNTPTSDEILDAIRAAIGEHRELASAPGITTSEIATALGCSQFCARRYITDLLKEGRMVVTRVQRRSMGGFGSPCEVQGYRLK